MARKNGLRALPSWEPEQGIPEEDRALIQRRVAQRALRRGPRVWARLMVYRLGEWLSSLGERLQLWAG